MKESLINKKLTMLRLISFFNYASIMEKILILHIKTEGYPLIRFKKGEIFSQDYHFNSPVDFKIFIEDVKQIFGIDEIIIEVPPPKDKNHNTIIMEYNDSNMGIWPMFDTLPIFKELKWLTYHKN